MKIYWLAFLFRDVFDTNASLQARGWGEGGVDKGQVQKDQQSPCFTERASDSLITSGYPGDQHRIYSFLCTDILLGVVVGARALSDEDEVQAKVKMQA